MIFYLGVHQTAWVGRYDFPMCVSHNRLSDRRALPAATGRWVLDSGGFTELQNHGRWRSDPEEYVAAVRRYAEGVGRMDWAAPQDWMCEPIIINGGQAGPNRFVGTGLSVDEHQRRTVNNLIRLRQLAPEVPWMPVLQGYTPADYERCADMYADAGVDLAAEPIVGLGSVCRRQNTGEIGQIVGTFARRGLRLHGFGVKLQGLRAYCAYLTSADSLAWSYDGRRTSPCLHGRAKNEANCPVFAQEWRRRALRATEHGQLDLLVEAYR